MPQLPNRLLILAPSQGLCESVVWGRQGLRGGKTSMHMHQYYAKVHLS